MLQAAEFGTVNFVVPGHERLEPIHIRVARYDIDLQAVRRDGERMGDIEGLEQELDDLAHLHREGPGLRTAVRAVRICHVETPKPPLRCYDHGDVWILRNRVGDHEGLERSDPYDDQDDGRNDRPSRLESSIVRLGDQRPSRVYWPHAEFADRVCDEDHDKDANRDGGNQHKIEELLRRALTGSECRLS